MKYQAIILYIEALIKDETLKSGSKLPSIRLLAEELKCSKTTVKKAYETLVENKIAYVIEKKGYYLMHQPDQMLMSDRIDFSSLYCKWPLLNHENIERLFKCFQLSLTETTELPGMFSLRDTLKRYFRQKKIFSKVDNIFITSNKHEAIQLILNAVPNHILVENPTDDTIVKMMKHHSRMVTFDRQQAHLDFNLLEYHFIKNNIGLLLITPDYQMPMGQVMSLEDRIRLLDLCYKHQVLIIENNDLEELNPVIQNQSLFALDKHNIVFHLKTFDIVFSKHIHIAALITPDEFVKKINRIKSVRYGHTATMEQLFLNEFLGSDDYLIELERLHKSLKRNSDKGVELLHQSTSISSLSHTPSFTYIKVNNHVNMDVEIKALQQKNIVLKQDQDYYLQATTDKGFIMSYTTINHHQCVKGIHLIMDRMK